MHKTMGGGKVSGLISSPTKEKSGYPGHSPSPFITYSPLSISPSVHPSISWPHLVFSAFCMLYTLISPMLEGADEELVPSSHCPVFSSAKEWPERPADTAEGQLHSRPHAEALLLWTQCAVCGCPGEPPKTAMPRTHWSSSPA